MIPQTELRLHCQDWHWQLQNCIRDPQMLADALNLSVDDLPGAKAAHTDFPVNVPLPYLSRIRAGDPDDPLLLQVMASSKELLSVPGFKADPVGDGQANVLPGVLHKYHGRVLFMVSTHCAINCRYCFRRHFPYQENRLNKDHWRQALDYITDNPDIHEVIYSGGDPLSASDQRLAWLTSQLADIPHVARLRVHTRLPVVIPQRVTAAMLGWLTGSRLQPVMVLHINHANEIDSHVKQMTASLRQAGVALLNQAVLLNGVNNQAETLRELSETLFSAGILPYYLHMLDPVQGASHFHVELEEARTLMDKLRQTLSGYLVPRLVREDAGHPGKTPL